MRSKLWSWFFKVSYPWSKLRRQFRIQNNYWKMTLRVHLRIDREEAVFQNTESRLIISSLELHIRMTHQLCSILAHISRHEMLLEKMHFEQGIFPKRMTNTDFLSTAFQQLPVKQGLDRMVPCLIIHDLPVLSKQLLTID